MTFKQKIMNTEREFPSIFTNRVEKDYGILYFNENNKISHDSNHAVLFNEKITDLEYVLLDIRMFYQSKCIEPRIYLMYEGTQPNYDQKIFEKCGFEITKLGLDRFFVLSEENQIINNKKVEVRLLREWDERIAEDIYLPDHDSFTPIVIQNSMKNPDYYCFAGYVNHKVVSTASFYISLDGIARLDSVETAIGERGKGYSREVIRYLVEYYKEHFKVPFYLWPANSTAEKIYSEAGFRLLFEAEAAVAVYHNEIGE